MSVGSDYAKDSVQEFWEEDSCGEPYAVGSDLAEKLRRQAEARYELEPYLAPFARFEEGADKRILEVGVGMGADHLQWAQSDPEELHGIDLTESAIEYTRKRLELHDRESNLQVADAENLPFDDDRFDLVYSWGVLHHSPNTARAIDEVHRVLRPGGTARIMIYHRYSIAAFMLWVRYALLVGKPFRTLSDVLANHMESPGTKAYTVDEARELFGAFSEVDVERQLSFGDLLKGEVGQNHRGPLLSLAKRIWPREFIAEYLDDFGHFLLIEAEK